MLTQRVFPLTQARKFEHFHAFLRDATLLLARGDAQAASHAALLLLEQPTPLGTTQPQSLPATVLEDVHANIFGRPSWPHSDRSNTKTPRRKCAPFTTTSWPRAKSIGLTPSGRPSLTNPRCSNAPGKV